MKLEIFKNKKREMIAAVIFFFAWGYAIYRFGKMKAEKGSMASEMKAPDELVK